jgi:WD40 repeat protein
MRRPNPPGGKPPDKVLIYKDQDDQPLASLSNIEVPAAGDAWAKDDFTFDKRVHFVPAARLLITIPASNDRLVMHRVDIESALEQRALWVASRAPAVAKNGDTYRYQLEVRAKNAGLEYRLDFGPPGMSIARSGLIVWSIPAHLGPGDCFVQASVQDAEKQRLEHRFSIHIEGGEPLTSFKPGLPFFASVLCSDQSRFAFLTPRAITVWDVAAGKDVFNIQRAAFQQLALSSNGERLAAANGQEILVWDIKSGKEVIQLKGDQLGRGVRALALSADGARLAGIVNPRDFSQPAEVKAWDLGNGKLIAAFEGDASVGISVLAFSPDGKRLAAGFGRSLKVWDVPKRETVADLKVNNLQVLSFSPDSSRVAFNAMDGAVVLDAVTGKELFLARRKAPVFHVSHSPDGKRLVCCGPSETAIHDAVTGKEIATLPAGIGVMKASFSRDGKWLAIMGQTEQFPPTPTLKICEASSGREVMTLTGHDRLQNAQFVGPKGNLLMTQGADNVLKVWQFTK